MKRLSLLRHAKSSWNDNNLKDRDRPLNKRGERDAPYMGARLLAQQLRPSLIITSPAVRAVTTARCVADALGYPFEFVHREADLYLASPRAIFEVLASQDNNFNDLLLVGHNPGLTDIINELLPDLSLDNLPTSGIVCLDSSAETWAEIADANIELVFYDYPKNPETLIIVKQ